MVAMVIVTENFQVSLWDPELGEWERRGGQDLRHAESVELSDVATIQVCGCGGSLVAMLLSFLTHGTQEQTGSKQKGKGWSPGIWFQTL